MTKPIIRIHNVETDEIIDREMNAKEFAQWELDQKTNAERLAEEAATANEKEALLKRLGITADEAKLLLA